MADKQEVDLEEKKLRLLKEIEKLESSKFEKVKESTVQLVQQVEMHRNELENLKKQGAAQEDILKKQLQVAEVQEKINLKQRERSKELEKIKKLQQEELEKTKKINEENEKQEKILKQQEETLKKQEALLEKKGSLTKSLISTLGGAGKSAIGGLMEGVQTVSGQLFDMQTRAMGPMGGVLSKINSEFGNIAANGFKIKDIIGGAFKVAAEAARIFGEMLKDLADKIDRTRAQGINLTGVYQSVAQSFNGSLAAYGIGMEKLTVASSNLYTSMSSFSNVNAGVQANLIANAAKMENLGVSSSTTANNFNILTKSLGFSVEKVTAINDKLAKAAIGAGIPPKKMAEEFATQMPRLAAYGQKAVDVFIKLQKEAKALGVEVSTLTNLVGDRFDTFEGAAESAGRLNAILGGNYLNSVEMLNASEEERVIMLKQAMEASGKNYDSLGKFEKKAIASALGQSDLNEMNKIFGTSTKEVEKEVKKAAATQEQLNSAQAMGATREEKIAASLEKFTGAAKELDQVLNSRVNNTVEMYTELGKKIDEFKAQNQGVIDQIKEWIANNPMWAQGLLILGSNLGNIASGLGILKEKFFGAAASVAEGSGTITKTVGDLGEKAQEAGERLSEAGSTAGSSGSRMGQAGQSAGSGAKGLMAFGVAIALVGVGIGAAGYGLSFLVQSFEKLSGAQILGALGALIIVMGGMAIAISILAAASLPAAGPLIALGVAMALLSLPILAVGKAMQWLLEGLGSLFEKMSTGIAKMLDSVTSLIRDTPEGAGTKLMGIAGGVVALGLAVAGMATAGAFGSLVEGITSLLGGKTATEKIKELIPVINSINEAKVNALVELSKHIVQITFLAASFGEAAEKIGPGLEKISKGIAATPDIAPDKIKNIASIADSFQKLSASASGMTNAPATFNALSGSISSLADQSAKASPALNGLKDSASKTGELIKPVATYMVEMVDKINTLPTIINNLSAALNGLANPVNVFKVMAQYVREVKGELASFPQESIEKINVITKSLQEAKSVSMDQLKPAKEFVDAMTNFYKAQSQSKDSSSDAIVAALREATSYLVSELQEGRKEGKNINVTVNGQSSDYGSSKLTDVYMGRR